MRIHITMEYIIQNIISQFESLTEIRNRLNLFILNLLKNFQIETNRKVMIYGTILSNQLLF